MRYCRLVHRGRARGRYPTVKAAVRAAKRHVRGREVIDVECCDDTTRGCWLQGVVRRDRGRARLSRI